MTITDCLARPMSTTTPVAVAPVTIVRVVGQATPFAHVAKDAARHLAFAPTLLAVAVEDGDDATALARAA